LDIINNTEKLETKKEYRKRIVLVPEREETRSERWRGCDEEMSVGIKLEFFFNKIGEFGGGVTLTRAVVVVGMVACVQ